jgi:alkanesulfonate monooxygenase SsuD/methylene tetrahydromethanopterin reductase-like flavin-dependent oxidoreductase (luciferase family)
MATGLRAQRSDCRVVLRIGVTLASEARPGEDERGRHAIEGPPQWVAERLAEYVEAGCDGFVVNLGHEREDFVARLRQFMQDVAPLL